MARTSRFSPEVRDRAVRMVLEHAEEYGSQWAAIKSIAEKIGCAPETLRSWVRQGERAAHSRARAASIVPARRWSGPAPCRRQRTVKKVSLIA